MPQHSREYFRLVLFAFLFLLVLLFRITTCCAQQNNQRFLQSQVKYKVESIVGKLEPPSPLETKSFITEGLAPSIQFENTFYFAENQNVIVKMDMNNGQSEIIAGDLSRKVIEGNGGPVINATFLVIDHLRVIAERDETSGNLYDVIYLSDLFTIRRIRMKTGIIDHIAGVIDNSVVLDVMPASSIRFERLMSILAYPKEVQSNSVDNVILTVLDSNIVRRIENGMVYRVCGRTGGKYSDDETPAINSTLLQPYRIDINDRNEIYIGERGSNRFRKILANGNIKTVYGRDFPLIPVSLFMCAYESYEYGCPSYITVVTMNETDVIYFTDVVSGFIRKLTVNNTDDSTSIEIVAGRYNKEEEECRDGIVQAFECDISMGSQFFIRNGRYLHFTDTRILKVLDFDSKMIMPFYSKENRILKVDGMKGRSFKLKQPVGLTFNYILNESNNKLEKVLFITESGFGAVRYYDLTTKTIKTFKPEFMKLESSSYIDSVLNYSISLKPISFDVFVTDDKIEYLILNEIKGIYGDSIIKVSQSLSSPKDRQISLLVGDALRSITNETIPLFINASSAMYNQPEGILATDLGIFVSDTYNNVIKLIDTNNLVRVVVKNVKKPTGLAYHVNEYGAKYLIFSETGRHQIKKINLDTNVISVLAGTGNFGYNGNQDDAAMAHLNEPRGMSISRYAINGLLFADSLNHRIRLIRFNSTLTDKSVFPITDIAGNGIPGNGIGYFNTPHAVGGCLECYNFFIADTFNNRIVKLGLGSGAIQQSVAAGSTQNGFSGDNGDPTMAQLFHPYSVSVSTYQPKVSFYRPIIIADTINSRLRYADNSIIKTIVGSGTDGKEPVPTRGRLAKLKYPKAIDIKDNHIYIADTSNNKIKKYSMVDDIVTTISGGWGDNIPASQSYAIPLGMTRSKNGNIYITDNLNNIIRKIDGATGIITTIAGTRDYGFFGENVPATSAILAYPTGIAVSPTNEIIIFSDTNNHRIRKISQDGIITTIVGTGNIGFSGDNGLAINAEVNSPTCIMLLPPNYEDFVFCDKNNGRLRRVTYLNGQIYIHSIAGNGTVDIVDIVADYQIESLKTALQVPLSKPEGVAFVENTGKLFVSDSLNNVVKQLVPFCENNFVLNPEKTRCVPKCYGLISVDPTVCTGNGQCVDSETCECSSQYSGNQCQYPLCFGIASVDLAVCSNSSGSCVKPNSCSCKYGYIGSECGTVACFGKTGIDACNGNLCVAPDTCQCSNSFGKECEHSSVLIGTIVGFSIFVLMLLFFSLLTMIIFFAKYKKQQKIIELDQMLDERLLSQTERDNETEFMEINNSQNSSFIIPIEQLNMDKPIKRLGEGGIGAVFQTRWKNNVIAVKVFDMNNMNISEKDFQMEALILSKLRHPNIIAFYGVSSSPTKRFIAMECLERSLDNLILQLQNNAIRYSFKQKLDILSNVANGIMYLHTLTPSYIVHRDLKPANVLMDKFGVCKLCDFGLSKMLSNTRASAVTSQIGTCYYLSPEMISSNREILGEDARAIDIYSFSIIIWQVLFECIDPYMSRNPRVLQKLRQEEPFNLDSVYQLHKGICENNLRPIIPFSTWNECKEWCREFDLFNEYEKVFELSELIRQSWAPNPSTRPSIHEIVDSLEKLMN